MELDFSYLQQYLIKRKVPKQATTKTMRRYVIHESIAQFYGLGFTEQVISRGDKEIRKK